MAAGPHAGDEVVHALREVPQDLGRRRAPVRVDVGGVVELHRNPRTWDLGRQLGRTRDRALHAELARRQLQLRAVAGHQLATLDRHGLGHRENEPVALDGTHEREADPGVARGRLHDHRARAEDSAGLGVLDHGQRDPVLDAPARVGPLELRPHLHAGVEEAVDPQVGCLADRGEDRVGLHRAVSFR